MMAKHLDILGKLDLLAKDRNVPPGVRKNARALAAAIRQLAAKQQLGPATARRTAVKK